MCVCNFSTKSDIKSYNESRSSISKSIARWEDKFAEDYGREASAEECEAAIGYLYETYVHTLIS